jgi:hypothetical protein
MAVTQSQIDRIITLAKSYGVTRLTCLLPWI